MTRAINPSHARQDREERAERHRVRQLLKTSAGASQWVREAQRELDNWLAGVPDDVVAKAAAELDLPRLVQDALNRRDTPSALAARVWSLVHEHVKSAQTLRPPCAACSHHAGDHSTVVDAWCYECKRECRYVEPADAWAWEADGARCIHDPSRLCSCESGAHCPRRPVVHDVPDYAQW